MTATQKKTTLLICSPINKSPNSSEDLGVQAHDESVQRVLARDLDGARARRQTALGGRRRRGAEGGAPGQRRRGGHGGRRGRGRRRGRDAAQDGVRQLLNARPQELRGALRRLRVRELPPLAAAH